MRGVIKRARTRGRTAYLHILRRVAPRHHRTLMCKRLEQDMGQRLQWKPVLSGANMRDVEE